jgi:hypothetical protein
MLIGEQEMPDIMKCPGGGDVDAKKAGKCDGELIDDPAFPEPQLFGKDWLHYRCSKCGIGYHKRAI